MRTSALATTGLFLAFLSAHAHAADRELLTKAGEPGTLAFDQLAGFRMTSANGFGFAGPLGFTYQRAHLEAGGGLPAIRTNTTTFFVAPAVDVFVLDRLSIGGVVQFQWQKQNVELEPGGAVSVPSTLGFLVLPRVGYLFRLGDRIALWPRIGAGYTNSQTATAAAKETSSGLVLEADVGLLYRINEVFFLRLAPTLTLSPLGDTTTAGGASRSTTFLAFSSTLGVGLLWDP